MTEDELGCEVVRIPAREMVVVLCIDRCPSMPGEPWKRIRAAAAQAVVELPTGARFAMAIAPGPARAAPRGQWLPDRR